MKQLISKLINFFRRPKALEPQKPSRVHHWKSFDSLTPQERQRAQDMLDDFLGHLQFSYRPEQYFNENLRSLLALSFYGGWESGFWDTYSGQENDTPCTNCSMKAFDAGLRAGSARAMLWVPPGEAK